MGNAFEYDEIAEDVFGPIFGIIADDIISTTGIDKGSLLDIGCGGGHMGYAVMDRGTFHPVCLLDKNDEAISKAEQRGKELGKSDEVDYVIGNVECMPIQDDSFDLVVSRGSMPFWDDQRKAFSEIHRVLKPNGCAYVGGGLGNKEQKERIFKIFANNDRGFKPFDRKKSKTLPDAEYEKLFGELKCEYRIINDPDKGHWFIIRKAQND